jgi:hypothetical protein
MIPMPEEIWKENVNQAKANAGRFWCDAGTLWAADELERLRAERENLLNAMVDLVRQLELPCGDDCHDGGLAVLRDPVHILVAAGRLDIVQETGRILAWRWKEPAPRDADLSAGGV